MARALGTTAGESQAEGLYRLGSHLTGPAGLLLTNRTPESVRASLASTRAADFARAGTVAGRDVVVPAGLVYSTGGEVPAADDVLAPSVLEPEFRRLGMPTRLDMGRVVLGSEPAGGSGSGTDQGYVICRRGDVLDARQTRLLRLLTICLAEFQVRIRACWTQATGEVEVMEEDETAEADAMEVEDEGEETGRDD